MCGAAGGARWLGDGGDVSYTGAARVEARRAAQEDREYARMVRGASGRDENARARETAEATRGRQPGATGPPDFSPGGPLPVKLLPDTALASICIGAKGRQAGNF